SGRVRGHTLAEVARKAGIDPAGLAVTVAAHNDAIAAGQPDPMAAGGFHLVIGDGPYTLLDISVRPSVIYPWPEQPDSTSGAATAATDTIFTGVSSAAIPVG
ncbi:FAD-binding protein, partial [Mycolicibacterium insubricum]|nr:FAD-binding protein [Mycolicibacterium insubricum]